MSIRFQGVVSVSRRLIPRVRMARGNQTGATLIEYSVAVMLILLVSTIAMANMSKSSGRRLCQGAAAVGYGNADGDDNSQYLESIHYDPGAAEPCGNIISDIPVNSGPP